MKGTGVKLTRNDSRPTLPNVGYEKRARFNLSSNSIAPPISVFCRAGSCGISRSIVSGPTYQQGAFAVIDAVKAGVTPIRVVLAALGKAKRWKYIAAVPAKPTVRGIETGKRFVSEQQFDGMLVALESDTCPVQYPFGPDYDCTWASAEWWTAFLVTAWVTGMQRGALLALRWEDVDLEAGEAVSRGTDNKGKRDHIVKLGPAVALLAKLKGNHPMVFPWNHATTWMDHELMAILQAAEIKLPCTASGSHECTPKCFVYTLHDFRRAMLPPTMAA
jgi:integrase